MPDIPFDLGIGIFITEFVLLCFVLLWFVERSIKRSFRHLNELIEVQQERDEARLELIESYADSYEAAGIDEARRREADDRKWGYLYEEEG